MEAKTLNSVADSSQPQKTAGPFAGLRELGQEFGRSIPNRAVAAFMAIGFSLETFALLQVRQPLVLTNWRLALFTIAFVFWFWLSAGLLMHSIARKARSGNGTTTAKHVVRSILTYAAMVIFVGGYAISWGIFLKTSQFASWELWRFSIANSAELTKYVTDAEPVHAFYGVAVIAASVIAFYFATPLISRRSSAAYQGPLVLNRLWFLTTVIMLSLFSIIKHQPCLDAAEQDCRQLTRSLNPVFSFWNTAIESLSLEPIGQPFDDLTELTPLSVTWSSLPETEVKGSDEGNQLNAPTVNSANTLPHIIVIQIESLRSDVIHLQHQGREVMPHLNKLANDALVWRNAYSQSTHSDYADPCIVSSLYPLRTRHHHYYALNDPWPKQLSYDCLKQLGYATATISSQNEMWGRMEHFLTSPNLDFFYHPERFADRANAEMNHQDPGFYAQVQNGMLKAGKFPDRHTASVAIDWIERQSETGKPFLLNMNLQSSHFPYLIPDEATKPFQPCDFGSEISFASYPIEATRTVRNAYYNSLHEIDTQLGLLIETLQRVGIADQTMLVVLGENGESFHENGQVCHANKPYEATTNIGLVMHGPTWLEPGVEDYPIEHVDILPTLFRRIGLAPHPNFQGIDALAADRPELLDRFLYFHTLSPLAQCDGLQWASRWKYLWDHQTSRGELYDLESDPGESTNLFTERPDLANALHDQLMLWRQRQLAWYHLPNLYGNFYPPKPPKFDRSDVVESLK